MSVYNRYVPQSDGSYRRSRQQETVPQKHPSPPPGRGDAETHHETQMPEKLPPCRQDGSVTGFLRKLLPKGFDTGDLFVVLLLLLIAGDQEEDKNTALLTLALYFFM